MKVFFWSASNSSLRSLLLFSSPHKNYYINQKITEESWTLKNLNSETKTYEPSWSESLRINLVQDFSKHYVFTKSAFLNVFDLVSVESTINILAIRFFFGFSTLCSYLWCCNNELYCNERISRSWIKIYCICYKKAN